MVKNLPTIERSTKVRFGKNATDDQAENTIVFNASNEEFTANTANALYLSPIRLRPDYDDPQIVLLMYNKNTKEITESGEAATDIIETTLEGATIRGNTINTRTVYFSNTAHASIVTDGIVGVANGTPQHTLSVGSNLYVHDSGSNVLVVSGNVSVTGNLTVNGGTTLVKTDNLIVKDPLIEIGQNNIVNDTSLDLGLIMSRPESNIVVGYREVSDEFVIAYTESSASSNTITPISSEDLDVHIYGGVWTESNVGIKTTSPDAELHVVGNVYATSNLTVDTDTFHVDVENDHVGVNTKNPNAELHVVGNVYASANLTVDTDTFHVDAEADHVGINTKNPDAELHVVGY